MNIGKYRYIFAVERFDKQHNDGAYPHKIIVSECRAEVGDLVLASDGVLYEVKQKAYTNLHNEDMQLMMAVTDPLEAVAVYDFAWKAEVIEDADS